jgi:flagellar protein FliS
VNRNGVDAYRQTDVMTADPKRLVIMCYEGAISNLKLAKKKYVSGEYEAKAKALQKTGDILDELLCALDLKKGGQIAENLKALYIYMRRRIVEGDTNREVGILDEVTGMLEELKHAWEDTFYGTDKDLADPVASRVSNQSAKEDHAMTMTYGPLGTL